MMPPSIMSPETEFGRMMQQAVAMKSEMMKSDRRRFDKFPSFYQNSIFHEESAPERTEPHPVALMRKLPTAERLAAAARLKEEGNELFQANQPDKAVGKYEEALSVFKYLLVKPGHEGWKKDGKGLRDEIFEEVDFTGLHGGDVEGADAAAAIKRHKVSCYLNIAACQLKLKGFPVCVQACGCALELDATNAKALYRRAQARLLPPSSGGFEQELALKDLTAAAKAEPDNVHVREQLRALKAQMAKQKSTDKATFTGMFDRGEIVEGNGAAGGEDHDERAWAQQVEIADRQIEDTEKIVRAYRKAGDEDKAQELEGWLDEAKQQLQAQRRHRMLESADFDNPTEEMIKDAAVSGIDLNDPAVREFCQKIHEAHKAGVPIEELEKADRGTLARTISWVERVLAKSPGARWALQLLAGYVCMVVMANLVRFLLHPHVFPGGEGEGESGGGDEGLLASLRGAAGLGRAQDDDDEF